MPKTVYLCKTSCRRKGEKFGANQDVKNNRKFDNLFRLHDASFVRSKIHELASLFYDSIMLSGREKTKKTQSNAFHDENQLKFSSPAVSVALHKVDEKSGKSLVVEWRV